MTIAATAICSNAAKTAMCLRAQEAWKDPAKREPMIGSIPLGKFAEPEDISDAVLFLLSDRAVS